MRILFMAICLASSFLSYSQYSVSGKITEDRKGAKNASVELLRSKDSSLVKSVLANSDGVFILPGISNGSYLLRVTMVGFKKSFTPVTISNADLQLQEIRLAENTKILSEVTVTTTKPFLEQRADKLIVNVENSATAAGSTALEILGKVPGIIISNDKISMVGKNNLNIMIDGRPSPYTDMTQLLHDMPASNIEKIEVISNPGAKYDASGGAIINIILKRNANLGTNGSLSLGTGLGLYDHGKDSLLDRTYYRISPSINFNHRKGKLNIYGGYSYLHRVYFEENVFDRKVQDSRFVQNNYAPSYVNSHNYRLGLDIYADNKNTFGALLRGFNRQGETVTNNETQQTRITDGHLLSEFQTLTDQSFHRTNIAANANWKHTFDTSGRELNVDFDYSSFQLDNSGHIVITQSSGAKSINDQLVNNPVKFGVLKLDYTHPLNKNSKFEAGLKSSSAQINNFLTFKRNGLVDPNTSNDFLYKEDINAAYASYQTKVDKWEFTGGLRAEQTIANGSSAGIKTLDRNYVQVFPSAFLTRTISKDFSAVLQYSKRVTRPSFQQQNPFVEFIDSLTYSKGNPLIKPQMTHASKFSLTYHGQPFFGVSYNVTTDVIFENAPRQQGYLAYATPENLGRFENVAFELNFPIEFGKKISGYGGNQVIYNHYKADYLGGRYDQSKWNWLAYWQVAYKPSTTFSLEISGFYMTRFLNEFLLIEPLGNLNFALQKSFWEKKGRISLNFNDIFYSNKTSAAIIYQDIAVYFKQRNESRNVRLVFNYSFGNLKLKAARNRTTASDSETERVKTN